ncbi:MAG: N-acetyltransferase [Chitinophagaceae bacterium]|nr:N-acetyltransferase [Chitinophagaceae bacterium]
MPLYPGYLLHFETEVPSVEDFAERIKTYLINWPWLVCEMDGKIAGYAYGTRYRERVAYQWCTESSIYMHDDFQKTGIGRLLYSTLFEILKRQGFRNVYAVINLPNEKSVAFHERLGFTYFATYEQVGYKLGKWKNVGWWRLILNEFGNEPAPPIKFSDLDKDFLPTLFEEKTRQIRK